MCVGCLSGRATASGAEVPSLTKLSLYSQRSDSRPDGCPEPEQRSKIAIKVAPVSGNQRAPVPLPPIVWGKGAVQSKLAVQQSSIIWCAPIQFTKFLSLRTAALAAGLAIAASFGAGDQRVFDCPIADATWDARKAWKRAHA